MKIQKKQQIKGVGIKMNNDIYLRMENIHKSFPGVEALKGVTFEVRKGTVHALVGENGAGKSTLMKILSGALLPDAGSIYIENKKIVIKNEADAMKYGVSMVYQELNYVPDMTIEENLFLGREYRNKFGYLNVKRQSIEAEKLLNKFKVRLNTKSLIKHLSVANIQMVEIIKAISKNANIIVFDEPTSSISEKDRQLLFSFIKDLKQRGITIIYISHKLEELDQIANYVTILRDGSSIDTKPKNELNRQDIIGRMVGRPLTSYYPKLKKKIGETILRVENLTKEGLYNNISFEVKAGEILGISGLIGAGRSEVMSSIFGIMDFDEGEIYLKNKRIKPGGSWDAIKEGIAFVPEDRKRLGLVLCRSLVENITLPHLKNYRPYNLNKREEGEDVGKQMQRFKVAATSPSNIANTLSGGNQQKVVLCKWMIKRPSVLILDEPTRGIDVGAKQEIYKYIGELASDGIAIIMVSSELPEILGMSDRILVMCEGKQTGIFSRNEASAEIIMHHQIKGM